MMKTKFQVLVFSFLLTFLLNACVFAAAQGLLLDGNVQRTFTSEDGLLSTASTAIAQTSEGFIWIGGYGGLVRYDGQNFEPSHQGEFANIADLLAGPDGELWIATADSGIYCYRHGSFRSLLKDSGIAEVKSLALDSQNRVWFGTENGIGYVDESETPVSLDIPVLREQFITQILCTLDGKLLLVTRSGRLYLYDQETCQRILLDDSAEQVRCAFQAQDGQFYIGSSNQTIWRCSPDLTVEETFLAEGLDCINDLCIGDEGFLWICADNGIAVWQDGELRLQRMKMDNSIDLMMEDMEGNYWFVSSRQGVMEVSTSRFENISQSAGLDSMVVNAIQKLGNRLYIGHDDGLLILDETSYQVIDDPDFARLGSVRIRCLYADREQNLWIGTKGRGLLCYGADHTWTEYDSAHFDAVPSDNCRCIYDNGRELIAGTDGGAFVIRQDGTVRNIVKDPESFTLRVLGISTIGDTCYLGTDGYGLYMIEDGQILGHTTTEDGLNSNVIMKFCKSHSRDGLWLVTGNKMAYIDVDGSIQNIDKFPSSNNLDFLILNDNEVWVFTGMGIFQTTEASLLSDGELDYELYRHADGLPFEVVANSNQCLTEELLYICGAGGIFSMDLRTPERKSSSFQLAIDGIRTDGVMTLGSPEQTYEIRDDVRRIEISAHVLTYQSGNPTVFYYLEGFDESPTELPLRSLGAITYTNLSGGDYLFHFGILDSDSGEIAREITLPLHKDYQWFERTQVRICAVVLGAALLILAVLLFIKARTKKLNRELKAKYEQKEKTRLKQIAYSDYLTGLSNRNYLDVWNEEVLPTASLPISFISADCNNLKQINDTYGHKHGDLLLQEMAALLKKHFDEDIYRVLRMGGDEFLILCTGVTGDQARAKMEALRREAATHKIEGIPITFGYGVYTHETGSLNFDEALRQSDLDMLRDKDEIHGREKRR